MDQKTRMKCDNKDEDKEKKQLSTINRSKGPKRRREPVARVWRLAFQFCTKITTINQAELKMIVDNDDGTHAVTNQQTALPYLLP